ncbi:V-type proton ATPase subunit S1-like [Rhagoletis pomonella]|uniref:V-type proton ATPase subunit S1-like n=1 Tax=Rhagoletis pomonella TaxID=28610 RepID=UPI00178214FA|nr:V-type proton ATPase subunit S1-like [Rhagoletis pomonella]
MESPLQCQPDKLYMISLDELKSHINPMKSCDEAIKNVVTTSVNCEDAAYVFLGTHEVSTERSGRLYQNGRISFYLTQLEVEDSTGFIQEIEFYDMNITGGDPKLTVELIAENSTASLRFNVVISKGYFQIDSFTFNDTTYYVSDLYAPISHSFSCGKILLKKDKKKLIIKRMQIQYDVIPHPSDFKFKDAWTCEGFTSPGIISGLFVTAIFVGVLSLGISMLMNVQSPTKFETPGGPILHINVVE